MNASLFDVASQVNACVITFPSQWCGMGTSCVVRQVLGLIWTTWSLLVWESAIRTRLFTSYKDRVRVIMTLWTSWDRLVIGVDVIIIFTFVRYSL